MSERETSNDKPGMGEYSMTLLSSYLTVNQQFLRNMLLRFVWGGYKQRSEVM